MTPEQLKAPCSTVEPLAICTVVRETFAAEGVDLAALGISDATLMVWLEHSYREHVTTEEAANGLYRHAKHRLDARAAGQVMDDDPLGVKLRHERQIRRYRAFKAAKAEQKRELEAAVAATKDGEPRPVPPTIPADVLEAAAAAVDPNLGGETP